MITKVVQGADQSENRIWKLSVLDQTCMGMVIKGTWVFPRRLPEESLIRSLSGLLNYYPQLAGRLTKGGVVCNNAGIPFTVCRDASLYTTEIVGEKRVGNQFAHRLDLARFRKGAVAPLTVRLTHLADGSVLSVHCAHACMDGSAFYTFMNNWAQLCRGDEIAAPVVGELPFVPDTHVSKEELIRRAKEMGWHGVGYKELFQTLGTLAFAWRKRRSVCLHFPQKFVDSWKYVFNTAHKVNYGTHTLLSALIVKLALKAAGIGCGEECSQVSIADMRGRMPEIPAVWAGNAVCNISAEPIYSGESVFDIAGKIDRKLRSLFSDGREAQEFMQLYVDCTGRKIPYLPFDLSGMNARRPTAIYINNFLKFRLYDLDFGYGKPTAVLPHDLPDQVRFWPGGPAGGVDVYFTGHLARLIAKLEDPYGMVNSFLEEYGVSVS